ncbi:MAG: 2-oxo acid dehydrogenase subunit E2 [Planctomycetota bacterium]|nr:2-oxo acid dehydrogenase subunit E2 [Planctomycetota bacterium]
MSDFNMPSLGADMDEGEILAWKVKPGDSVRKGDVLLEVDTSKAAFDVEADHDGVVEEILVEPGRKVAVGTPIARIRQTGEALAKPAPKPVAPHLRITPLARVVAKDLGVDPAKIGRGTGIDGAITRADVERAAAKHEEPHVEKAPPPPSGADKSKREGLRDAIAAAMSRSKREIPHYYLSQTIDLEPALNWLEKLNAGRPITERILSPVLLLKAVAHAIWEVPELNGYWTDGALNQSESVHLGVAISLHSGVIAPAIHDADDMSLEQLMAALADLVQRARHGTLKASEMTDSTITVTNLGDRGPEAVYGVIYPPQVALVGFGAVMSRALVIDGQLVARRSVIATLSADHRASDGHRGGLFLRAIARLLEHPESL